MDASTADTTEKPARRCDDPPPYTPYSPPTQAGDLPPGYQPYSGPPPWQWQCPTTYGSTTVTVQPAVIIKVGECPACRIGVLEDYFSCLGILCAIFCFPFGILACLLLKSRRCSNCGAYFG